MPRRPTKAELRKALDAFLPPDAGLTWADEWPTKEPNSPETGRRTPTIADDPQVIERPVASASDVGPHAARHPDEGRE